MVTILRKIKVKFIGEYEIKGIDKNQYYIVVATKEQEASRSVNGWCFGSTNILFYGIIYNYNRLVFIDSKDCLVKLG